MLLLWCKQNALSWRSFPFIGSTALLSDRNITTPAIFCSIFIISISKPKNCWAFSLRNSSIFVSSSVVVGQEFCRDFAGRFSLGVEVKMLAGDSIYLEPGNLLPKWLTPLAGKWVLIVGKMFRCLTARGLPAGCFRILTGPQRGSSGGIQYKEPSGI